MSSGITAFGIVSGGLDSLLACRVLLDQEIRVVAITFVTPFFGAEKARRFAAQLPVEHRVVDITAPHLRMMAAPKYGFGKGMNPCIDCHGLMFREAGRIMEAEEGSFLFSGEVLGQRPMSQNRQSLKLVEKLSGYPGLILRPLSAQRLDPTRPEEEGLVDRERLLGFTGRGRKQQIALAARHGLEYPGPAGGCSLTEPNYSRRLRDLVDHGLFPQLQPIAFLDLGRHLRLSEQAKLIVGRNERENARLVAKAAPEDVVLLSLERAGPAAVLTGRPSPEEILQAARVVARYVRVAPGEEVVIDVRSSEGTSRVQVEPIDPDWIESRLI